MYDYILFLMVGAGSAGSLLAGRFTDEAGTALPLIEASPVDPTQDTAIPAAWSIWVTQQWMAW